MPDGPQAFEQLLQNAIHVYENIVIPKPDDIASTGEQKFCPSLFSIRAFGMLATIQLDDQVSLLTKEVDDIRADRVLPTELEPFQ